MKISYLWIKKYKNLNDFEIHFEEDSSVNVIIGNNGSGKSNLIEALVSIFVSLKQNVKNDFDYKIEYELSDRKYLIKYSDGKYYCLCDEYKVDKKDIVDQLPTVIFSYYSGETKRLEEMTKGYVDKVFVKALKTEEKMSLKYLSFISVEDFPNVLLANYINNTKILNELHDLLNIDGVIGNINFNLKRPNWSKSAPITNDSFWNAQGSVSKTLHEIKDCGYLDISSKDVATIIVDDTTRLNKIGENCFDTFTKLKMLQQADILDSVEFSVIKSNQEIKLDFFSEGEKQIALTLCILEATKDYRSLFLLDEIDSYLHPSWQRKFAEMMDGINIKGQVIFTTHSPYTLGKFKKDNVRILKDGDVYMPLADTFNRDVFEITEEVMDVSNRPDEINEYIKMFRNNIMHGRTDEALDVITQFERLLSDEDPFWKTIEATRKRMGI